VFPIWTIDEFDTAVILILFALIMGVRLCVIKEIDSLIGGSWSGILKMEYEGKFPSLPKNISASL